MNEPNALTKKQKLNSCHSEFCLRRGLLTWGFILIRFISGYVEYVMVFAIDNNNNNEM